MPRLNWDQVGERYYENGVQNGVLYPVSSDGTYPTGVAWNGLTSVAQNPSGADANKKYADNRNYVTIYGAEEFGATVEAYTNPPEFAACDGFASPVPGVRAGQQPRKGFGLSYMTNIGNDTVGSKFAFMLHLIYGCRASPSSRTYETFNESPDAMALSWEITTTPVNVEIEGYEPLAYIEIDSRDFTDGAAKTKLDNLLDVLYGKDAASGETGNGTTARLPLPDEVFQILGYTSN